MFRLGVDLKVYLHREPIDFRAGINSLAGADQLGPHLNIVILRDSHQSGYILGSVGPSRHLARS